MQMHEAMRAGRGTSASDGMGADDLDCAHNKRALSATDRPIGTGCSMNTLWYQSIEATIDRLELYIRTKRGGYKTRVAMTHDE